MAFPTVVNVFETSKQVSTNANYVVTLPTTGNANDGDWFVALIAAPSAMTFTPPAGEGWTELVEPNTAPNLYVAYKRWSTGQTLGSATFAGTASAKAAILCYQIRGAHASTAPTLSTAVTGTGTSPNPGNCNPGSADDFLWITFFSQAGEVADTDVWLTTVPNSGGVNWPDNRSAVTSDIAGAASTNCQLGACWKTENAASDDAVWPTGSSSVSAAWRAHTIAIPPAPAGNAWTANPADSTTVSDSIGSFGWGPGIADSTALSDAQTKLETKELVPSDTVTPTDAQAFDYGKGGLADTETPTDSAQAERVLVLLPADTETPTDSITSFGRGTEPADSSSPTDAQSFGRSQSAADTESPTDAQSFNRTQGVADSTALTDAIQSIEIFKDVTVSDSTALADAIAIDVRLTLGDSTAVSDAQQLERAVQQAVADSLTTTDSLYFDHGRAVADAVSLAEAQSFGIGSALADVLIVADGTTTARGVFAALADATALTDNVDAHLGGNEASYVHTLLPQTGVLSSYDAPGVVVLVVADGIITAYTANGTVTAVDDEGDLV